MLDRFHRKISYVRISVTDRCTLRCRYCMPAEGIEKLRHDDILSYEEILRVVRVLASLGVEKVRLTGGEPLVRPGVTDLVARIKAVPGIRLVTMTTNGLLLREKLGELEAAGLDGINMSLDTMKAATFERLSRLPLFEETCKGLSALLSSGIKRVKLNCVPIEGVNDGELVTIASLAREHDIDVRFIELMPIGCAYQAGLRPVKMARVRAMMEAAFGGMLPVGAGGIVGPAEVFQPAGFSGRLGFIDAIDHKFCSSCNRVRLTAEGFLKLCLAAPVGLDVRALLRGGADDAALRQALSDSIYGKPKEHAFRERGADDTRAMVQVGG